MKKSYYLLIVLLLVLAVYWLILGVHFHAKAVPFYDSVTYRRIFLGISDSVSNNGIFQTIKEFSSDDNRTALFFLIKAIFNPLLPSRIETLYVFHFTVYLFFIILLFRFILRATKSSIMAVLSVAIFLSAASFSNLNGGVLDQRLDFTAASFLGITLILAIKWLISPRYKNALFFGFAASLTILYRPLFIVILFLVFVLFWALFIYSNCKKGINREKIFLHVGIMLLPFMIIVVPWLTYNFFQLKSYYLVYNRDVNTSYSVFATFKRNLLFFQYWLGIKSAILIAIAATFGLMYGGFKWRRLVLLGVIMVSLFLPIVISRSAINPLISLVGIPVVAFLPWCFPIQQSRCHSRLVKPAILAIALIFVVVNAYKLGEKVYWVGDQTRRQSLNLIEAIYKDNNEKPFFVHGFLYDPVSPETLTVIGQEAGISIRRGLAMAHVGDFGILPSAVKKLTAGEIKHYSTKALNKIVHEALYLTVCEDYLILPDWRSAVYLSKCIYQPSDYHRWSYGQIDKIVRIAKEIPEIIDTGITQRIKDVTFKVYRIDSVKQ